MLVRPASPADLPVMRALEQQSATAAHWADREYHALFAAEAPPRIALVAVRDDLPLNTAAASQELYGAPIGFLIARTAGPDWEIENVVVAADYRRRGFGSALIRELLRRAQKTGATSVLLEVRESNQSARRLYEKLGFSEHGRRRNYYQQPTEDALLLRFFVAVL